MRDFMAEMRSAVQLSGEPGQRDKQDFTNALDSFWTRHKISFGLESCALYLFYVFACYNDRSFVTVSILIERFHDSR